MRKFLLLFFTINVILNAQQIETKQLIVVTTKDWKISKGLLQRYEKVLNRWIKVDKPLKIHIGRNGLGWGVGLHQIPSNAKIIKKEGDGKAPAGIFELKNSFGYNAFKTNYPYRIYKKYHHCVDDMNSKLYNKIIDSRGVKESYKSKENMRLSTDYYKYGIVVNHNHINEKWAKKGAGSCIFLHIKNQPTAGCTVMNEKELIKIIEWLDKEKNPLLIQGTKKVVKKLLKEINFY